MFNVKNLKYPPNVEIDESNFPNAWAKLVMKIMQAGMIVPTEYGNYAKDVCSRVTLSGKALQQIASVKMHKRDPFGEVRTKEYLKQFTSDYDWEDQGFEYTYYDRLTHYRTGSPIVTCPNCKSEVFVASGINQLHALRDNLTGGVTRRAQAITWRPKEDTFSQHPPCLQRIWIRPLTDETCEVHLMWRSRDAYGAWASNLCGIVRMIHREVLDGSDFEIVKLVDVCNSAHVYDYDWDAANKVVLEK